MAKRLPLDAKIHAYNEAIAFLEAQESESDTPEDLDARQWLAEKLDRECDRLVSRHRSNGDQESPK